MIIPDGFAQVNLVFSGSGMPTGGEVTQGINVQAFAGNPTECAETIAAGILTSAIEDLWVAQVTLAEVRVKFGPNATGPSGVATMGEAGDAGGTGWTPNTSMLVQKVTALGGRAGRGRSYWPGVPEAMVDVAGALDTTFQATAQGVFDDWLAKLAADDLNAVVLHGAGSPISLPTAIQAFVVAPIVATQRRRLRR